MIQGNLSLLYARLSEVEECMSILESQIDELTQAGTYKMATKADYSEYLPEIRQRSEQMTILEAQHGFLNGMRAKVESGNLNPTSDEFRGFLDKTNEALAQRIDL